MQRKIEQIQKELNKKLIPLEIKILRTILRITLRDRLTNTNIGEIYNIQDFLKFTKRRRKEVGRNIDKTSSNTMVKLCRTHSRQKTHWKTSQKKGTKVAGVIH